MQCEHLRVGLSLSLTDELLPVKADSILIQQVVMNLVINGIEAMTPDGRGERHIMIMTHQVDQWVEVSVHDSGVGIANEKLINLFEPFFTTKMDGTGLGLSICRDIVEEHGGRIWIEQRSEGGSVFYFSLPILDKEGAFDQA